MAQDLKDLERMLRDMMNTIPKDVPIIIEQEGLLFIRKNFKDEGFNTGSGVKKWKNRKTTDTKGRDITRYRTSRRGRQGSLTKYGRNIQGRGILVGHGSGGNTLRNSFHASRTAKYVKFYTYKSYAEYHNEGKGHMPPRPFMKPSRYLDKRIENKLTRTLDKRFNK